MKKSIRTRVNTLAIATSMALLISSHTANAQNVGIGTPTPGSKLSVSGNAVIGLGYAGLAGPTDGLAVQGNVGIGTAAPGAKLEINGYVMINDGNSDGARLIWRGGAGGTQEYRARVYTDGSLSFFPIEVGNPGYVGNVLVLTQSGNVGIGATAPWAKLHVIGDTRIGLVKVDQADAGVPGYGDRLFFSGGPHTSYPDWNSDNSDPLWIARYNAASNATELRINVGDYPSPLDKMVIGTTTASWSPVMTIQMNGNVGIGTAAPVYQLQLSMNSAAKPGSNTWTVVSDERLKNIVGKYSKGLKEILQLNPILYYYKNSDKRTFAEPVLKTQNVGFSAQEVQKVFPEAVDTDEDGYLNFDMHAILVAYTNAIKELKAELDKLTTVNEQLTKNISHLQTQNTELRSQNTELRSRIEKIEQILSTTVAENK